MNIIFGHTYKLKQFDIGLHKDVCQFQKTIKVRNYIKLLKYINKNNISVVADSAIGFGDKTYIDCDVPILKTKIRVSKNMIENDIVSKLKLL
jgi:hypothetical protein